MKILSDSFEYDDYEGLRRVNPELYDFTLALISGIPSEMEAHERKYRNIKNKELYIRLRNALVTINEKKKEELSKQQQEYLKNLINTLYAVLEQKKAQEKIIPIENPKKEYSEEEKSFLKQINTWYLNWYEALATGRTQQYEALIRLISFKAADANIPLMVTVNRHNENLSPLQYFESLKQYKENEMDNIKKSSK